VARGTARADALGALAVATSRHDDKLIRLALVEKEKVQKFE
jgi:hypothetical protein